METALVFIESMRREAHAPIATYYLGRSWEFSAPWHYAAVMTAVTVPLGILALVMAGSVRAARERLASPVAWLAVSQVLFFFALLATRPSPNHDGVRLFLPAFPFLALLAGGGFSWIVGRFSARLPATGGWKRGVAFALLGAVFFVPAGLQTFRVRPFHLSYYNEVLGGAPGAARAGMEATYWLEAVTPDMAERVNALLPPGASVAVHPNPEHFRFLQELGLLRGDLVFQEAVVPPGANEGRYVLLVARKAMFEPWHFRLYRDGVPALATELDGVLLAALYEPGELPRIGLDGAESASR